MIEFYTLGQQGQLDPYYEQQRRAAAPQSPLPPPYQQEQHISTTSAGWGQQYEQAFANQQQQHDRTDSNRQYQDEQGILFLSGFIKPIMQTLHKINIFLLRISFSTRIHITI